MLEIVPILLIGYLVAGIVTALLWIVIGKFVPSKWQLLCKVTSGTLMLSLSFGPATIVLVPLPYGLLLLIGLFGGFINEALDIAVAFWQWHVISFSVTAALLWFILVRFRSRSSRGGAHAS